MGGEAGELRQRAWGHPKAVTWAELGFGTANHGSNVAELWGTCLARAERAYRSVGVGVLSKKL